MQLDTEKRVPAKRSFGPSNGALPKGPYDCIDHAQGPGVGPCISVKAEGQSGLGAQGMTLLRLKDDGPWLSESRFGLQSPGIPGGGCQPHINTNHNNLEEANQKGLPSLPYIIDYDWFRLRLIYVKYPSRL